MVGNGELRINNSELPIELGSADHWILTKRDQLVRDVTQAYESFEFSKAAQLAYDFAWHDFADWYIEATKLQTKPHQKIILLETLEIILKLLHPAMPFVTEALWERTRLQRSGTSDALIIASWPTVLDTRVSSDASTSFDYVREIATAIRQVRNEEKIPPKTLLDVTLAPGSDDERVWLTNDEVIALIKGFTRAKNIHVGEVTTPRATVRTTNLYVQPSTIQSE